MPLTRAERQMRARIGGHTVQAKYGSDFIAARARRGLVAKFEREAREQYPNLSESELAQRAEQLRKAYYARLALRSAVARRKAREYAKQAEAIESELATLDNDRGSAG